MSKNKKKDANAKSDVPVDFQVESKNLQYTITLKDQEIDLLQKENQHKKEYITQLEQEIQQLRKDYIKAYELENTIKGHFLIIKEHSLIDINKVKNWIQSKAQEYQEQQKNLRIILIHK